MISGQILFLKFKIAPTCLNRGGGDLDNARQKKVLPSTNAFPYLSHPLGAGGHEDECQAQEPGQSGRRPGYGEEGEGQCSSCERCLLASEF